MKRRDELRKTGGLFAEMKFYASWFRNYGFEFNYGTDMIFLTNFLVMKDRERVHVQGHNETQGFRPFDAKWTIEEWKNIIDFQTFSTTTVSSQTFVPRRLNE